MVILGRSAGILFFFRFVFVTSQQKQFATD